MVNIKEILTLVSRKTNLSRKECLDILRQYKVNGRNFNSIDEVVYLLKIQVIYFTNPHQDIMN